MCPHRRASCTSLQSNMHNILSCVVRRASRAWPGQRMQGKRLLGDGTHPNEPAAYDVIHMRAAERDSSRHGDCRRPARIRNTYNPVLGKCLVSALRFCPFCFLQCNNTCQLVLVCEKREYHRVYLFLFCVFYFLLVLLFLL